MDLLGGREGLYEDQDEQMMNKGGGNYKPSFSSSSPSSSSSQHKGLVPLTSGQWEAHHQIYDENLQQQQQQRGWLGKKHDQSGRCFEFTDDLDVSAGHGGGGGNEVDADDVRRRRGCEREHMFDKVVTPSDVGKLNRLVIPKQHAERYFPLDSSTNEKGLLLNFEDRCGKPWRFRYSYWNSSQSYVMTKGWSRFVKEKKLDAGDIVSFQRGVGELGKDRLYIDWRRRCPDAPAPASLPTFSLPQHHHHHHFSFHQRSLPWSPLLLRPPAAAAAALPMSTPPDFMHYLAPQPNNINVHHQYSHWNSYTSGASNYANYSNVVNPCSGSVFYLGSAAPQQVGVVQVQQSGVEPMVYDSVPVVHGKAAAKRLRLFGVNMECPASEESDECDILSSTAIPHATMPSSSLPPHQLRLYNGTPLPTDLLKKGKASMSLDLDI